MAKATLFLELNKEQLSVLRRALEASVRDMRLRQGSDPGDEGFQREARLATQLLRQVEALERQADYRAWDIRRSESLPEDNQG
jgi:primosomal protein N''